MPTASFREYSGTAAELYQSFFVPAIATPASDELLRTADLRAGERVLDVACGTGIITRAAAEQVGQTGTVTAIDLAPDMLEVAKATPAAGAPIEWHQADAASLPLPDASYDVALCQMGVMFMEDRTGALAELHRVLTPGGRVVINTPGRIQPLFKAMEQAIVEHIGPELGAFVSAVFSMHDPSALAALLDDTGFTDVSSKEYTAHFTLRAHQVPLELHQPHAHGPDRGRGVRGGQGGHGTPSRRGVDAPRRRRNEPTRPADRPRLGSTLLRPAPSLGSCTRRTGSAGATPPGLSGACGRTAEPSGADRVGHTGAAA